jgi:competence protein ComGC
MRSLSAPLARARGGFMFIELLIVLGIMGILMTIVIVAINPTKHLCVAANTKRNITVRELEHAINEYQIRMNRRIALGAIPVGEANAIAICTENVTDPLCINLDVLVPDYIINIPQDPSETNPVYSGYKAYRTEGGQDHIQSDHIESCL